MLLGRFLTRSGDQAWDFAVPIVMLQIFPGHLRVAALYYLIVRIATVFVLPWLSRLIDHINRLKAAKIGIFLQLIGVAIGLACVLFINQVRSTDFFVVEFIFPFVLLCLSGLISQLGSTFMDISIANDLVPSRFSGDELSAFNSRLRQLDLFTEVTSPILAGGLLLLSVDNWPLLGFSLIAMWNLISFFPEYGILKSIFKEHPDLNEKPIRISSEKKSSIFLQLNQGWRSFFREPVAGVVLAYSLLWMSALSPHGVLLTAFLKDGWQMPEWIIGTFRGAGAIFGLLATVVYPLAVRKTSVERASLWFLGFQAVTLTLAYAAFLVSGSVGQIGFLVLILFSRIGLYGFSLGEMQIRQMQIRPESRGEINGFANALTTVATIFLFTVGVGLPSTEDFKILILTSVGCVLLALIVYLMWFHE